MPSKVSGQFAVGVKCQVLRETKESGHGTPLLPGPFTLVGQRAVSVHGLWSMMAFTAPLTSDPDEPRQEQPPLLG